MNTGLVSYGVKRTWALLGGSLDLQELLVPGITTLLTCVAYIKSVRASISKVLSSCRQIEVVPWSHEPSSKGALNGSW